MKTIAFVVPWFGENIPGGAEMEARELVTHLYNSGLKIEVLTTCVEKFASDWNVNYYKEGTDVVLGVPVRRFKVRKRDSKAFDNINYKFINNKPVTLQEEDIFLKEMVNSTRLYDYMREHQDEYSLFVFIPYMFGTTYNGCQVCPEKSVLIPCLHDESYAHMKRFKEKFSQVAGMSFLSKPEDVLAHELYDLSDVNTAVLGAGVDTDLTFNAERFREKYKINDPFILYAGRKETGKNVHTLLQYFARYKSEKESNLKLVLIGGGEIEIPKEVKDDVYDLGFLPIQDKYDAQSAASLFCNPSKFESFSLVIMESWLCHRPVIVYGGCEVTKEFVKQSNGGLYFENYYEFVGTVDYILEHKEIADQMGLNGCDFVHSQFAWDVIVEKYTKFFNEIA